MNFPHGLCCPICGAAMTEVEGALRCLAGHSFDRAREGYYNLLAVQHKASKDPGDSREMVAARRRVLDAGLYAPIATRTCEIIATMGECATRSSMPAAARATISTRWRGPIPRLPAPASTFRNGRCGRRRSASPSILGGGVKPASAVRAGSVDVILSMFGFPLWDAFAAVQPAERVCAAGRSRPRASDRDAVHHLSGREGDRTAVARCRLARRLSSGRRAAAAVRGRAVECRPRSPTC